MAWGWVRRNVVQVVLRWGARIDPGLVEDLPHDRGGDPDAEDQ
jgi:hypothetical protein